MNRINIASGFSDVTSLSWWRYWTSRLKVTIVVFGLSIFNVITRVLVIRWPIPELDRRSIMTLDFFNFFTNGTFFNFFTKGILRKMLRGNLSCNLSCNVSCDAICELFVYMVPDAL